MQCPQRPKGGVRSPGTGVNRLLWTTQCNCWESNPHPLQEDKEPLPLSHLFSLWLFCRLVSRVFEQTDLLSWEKDWSRNGWHEFSWQSTNEVGRYAGRNFQTSTKRSLCTSCLALSFPLLKAGKRWEPFHFHAAIADSPWWEQEPWKVRHDTSGTQLSG